MNYLKSLLTVIFATMIVSLMAQTLNDAGSLFNEAIQLQKDGQNEQAITAYKNCIDIASQLGMEGDDLKMKSQSQLETIYLNMGIEAYKSKKPDEAINYLSESYNYAELTGDTEGMQKVNKLLGSVYSYKGKVSLKQKDFTAAADFLNKAIGYYPDTDEYYYLVYTYSKSNDETNMIATMDKLIELGRDGNEDVQKAKSVVSKYYLADAVDAAQDQNFGKVIDIITKSFAYNDKEPLAYYYMAVAYNAQKEYDKAIQAAETGIALVKDDPSNYYFEAAKGYEGLGKNDKACENYKKVTDGPNLEAAKYQITTVLKCN